MLTPTQRAELEDAARYTARHGHLPLMMDAHVYRYLVQHRDEWDALVETATRAYRSGPAPRTSS